MRVPAKINLALRVGERREDGYHELSTVFQAVSLYDTVTACHAGEVSVTVVGEGAGQVPTGDANLAVRAARLLAARAGVRAGVRLRLDKAIPLAGGMAGGSADAAGALVACDTLWGTDLGRPELLALAAQLGSDVPFALHGGTALGTGRGVELTDVLARGRYHWVLALAGAGLSTAQVYSVYDQLGRPPAAAVEPVLAALRAGDPVALAAALVNDLQPAALRLRPELSRLLEAGLAAGALGAVVSGSGPTLAFLAAGTAAADQLAVDLAGLGLARAVRRADGPVGGARLVAAADA